MHSVRRTLRTSLSLVLLCSPLAAQTAHARPQAETWERDPVRTRAQRIALTRDALAPDAPRRLTLDLFDGERLELERVRAERTSSGSRTWVGTVPSDPLGSAAFALHGEAVVGSVRANGALYRVRENRDGSLELYQCDESAFPSCEASELPAAARAAQAAGLQPVRPPVQGSESANAIVDVLVAWTPEAEAAAGSREAIRAVIDLAVLETNVALANSQVTLTLRLVHATRVPYVESGSQATDLERLQSPLDGHLDELHILRSAYGADVVSVFIANDEHCGRSYNMGAPPSLAFGTHAVNVVAQGCATGYYAFAHELGHGWGLDHDRTNVHGVASHPYAYGHWTANNVYRTIMALERWGTFGTRLQYFSNPALKYENQELGVPNSSSVASNCAQALNENAPIVSAFRAPASIVGHIKPTCTVGETAVASAQVPLNGTIQIVLADPDQDVVAGSLPVVVLSGVAAGASCTTFPSMGGMLESLVLYRVGGLWEPSTSQVLSVAVPGVASLAGLTLSVQTLFYDRTTGRVTPTNGETVTITP